MLADEPHKLQSISSAKGIELINDSKSTNWNSTWFALETMKKPTILIIGAYKNEKPDEALLEIIKEKVK